MRVHRFLFATLFAAYALVPAARAAEVQPAEFIVNSQVISDVAVEAAPSNCPGGACAGDLASGSDGTNGGISGGSFSDGGVAAGGIGNGAVAGRLASGRIGGRLAGATSYIGDLARGARPGEVGCVPRTYGYPDLFYNFYTQGNCNQTNAQMYVAPVPVPPNVGHTFYTYQPFMPHEMLYWHTDRFHNYYDGGRGMNHTKVHYYAPPIKQAASNLYWNYLRIPR